MIRKPVEKPANGIAYSFGNDPGPPGVLGNILQRDLARYLTDEQRVAVGALMYGFCSFESQIYPRDALDQISHFFLGKAIQLHSVE